MSKSRFVTCVMIPCLALAAATAAASGPLGPPCVSLAPGEVAVGAEYAYSGLCVELRNGRSNAGALVPGMDIEPMKMQTVTGAVGYGISDWCEAAVRVGMARGHWDEEGERFDGDADLFFGIGARTTVWDEDDWTVGAFAQADWAETDGDIEGTGWAGDSSVEFVHIRVGAGPTYQLTDRIRVYGGPFWQIIDGDKDYDERMPAPGYAEEFDLEGCSSYGGYVGAQIQLFPQATGCVEWQFGGGDSVVGVTVLWVFGSDR